ncbi:hypothetical protein COV23_02240 [Candidatus Wolfebacteria bacterium CG10_big_fil_rev_8_21_14_0_10_31_9]|uniref:Endolytic murein transglycosylase n=1 Tax=Candidatus Wolfebacteria bacterium CG10_big_fil_rev_8_21_14_0_10_31_9 TaxID=1975070 RepID=A0A2H0RD99_9BACT|nr:MAG: hypothetical protein COV23_02240 [Candidatus Wolfebacteria bacterium CG10_big_fil_rev_8_21_14_0_10_31_9]
MELNSTLNIHKARLIRNSIIMAVFLIVLCAAISLALFLGELQPKNKLGEISNVNYLKISRGMGIKEIGAEIYTNGIIKSDKAFFVYSLISGKGASFKPGVYELNSNQSVPEIATLFSLGPRSISVVITPGMTLKEIDDYLSSLKIIPKGSLVEFNINTIKDELSFLKNAHTLEGFLFPDTYIFFIGSDIKDVVYKILNNFKIKTEPYLASLESFKTEADINWLIIASMIEKEVVSENDIYIVSGIIQNRLNKKMPLQIDATVIYAKCQGRFLNCPELNSEDFKIDSSYNTYKYSGLPISPISNPGMQSIKAAINPEKTNYLFYLSDPKTGKTIFSKTFNEHTKNRQKYLMI